MQRQALGEAQRFGVVLGEVDPGAQQVGQRREPGEGLGAGLARAQVEHRVEDQHRGARGEVGAARDRHGLGVAEQRCRRDPVAGDGALDVAVHVELDVALVHDRVAAVVRGGDRALLGLLGDDPPGGAQQVEGGEVLIGVDDHVDVAGRALCRVVVEHARGGQALDQAPGDPGPVEGVGEVEQHALDEQIAHRRVALQGGGLVGLSGCRRNAGGERLAEHGGHPFRPDERAQLAPSRVVEWPVDGRRRARRTEVVGDDPTNQRGQHRVGELLAVGGGEHA